MKKTLLILAMYASTFAFSQTLQNENFDALNVGNIGTDLTGTTSGQGGYFTYVAATGVNSNFQIVAETTGKSLQLNGSSTAANPRYMWKDGLATSWSNRTAGNNVINIEFDIYTGAATTSKNSQSLYLYNTSGDKILAGFSFAADTKTLLGVCYLNNNGTLNNYSLNLGTPPVVLPVSQWVRIGMSFNKTTGQVSWKGPGFNGTFMGAATGLDPAEIDFVMGSGTGNTVAYSGKYDNLLVWANTVENLLDTELFVASTLNTITVYPNPATDVLNVAAIASDITAIQIVDLNGRQVYAKSFSNVADTQINVNELSTGMYLVNITSGDKTVTKKFMKQ